MLPLFLLSLVSIIVDQIMNIPITLADQAYIVIWKHSANGECTSKSAFKTLTAHRISKAILLLMSVLQELTTV